MALLKRLTIWSLSATLGGVVLPLSAQDMARKPRAQQRTPVSNSDLLREEFSFKLKDFKVDHQAEINTLQVQLRYTYKAGIKEAEYPNFIPMAKDVEQFLTNYPNESTYWEIVNKELTQMVLDKYPALSSVTCEIEVSPSPRHPFTRASHVTRQRSRTAVKRQAR